MILYTLLNRLPIRSTLVKVAIGAALVALVVSLAIVFVMQLMGMDVNPAVPSAVAAIAAGLFAARMAEPKES